MRKLVGIIIFGALSIGVILQGSGALRMRLPSFAPDAAPAEALVSPPSEAPASSPATAAAPK